MLQLNSETAIRDEDGGKPQKGQALASAPDFPTGRKRKMTCGNETHAALGVSASWLVD